MDERDVRAAVQAVGDALVAGNVDGAIAYLSDESTLTALGVIPKSGD